MKHKASAHAPPPQPDTYATFYSSQHAAAAFALATMVYILNTQHADAFTRSFFYFLSFMLVAGLRNRFFASPIDLIDTVQKTGPALRHQNLLFLGSFYDTQTDQLFEADRFKRNYGHSDIAKKLLFAALGIFLSQALFKLSGLNLIFALLTLICIPFCESTTQQICVSLLGSLPFLPALLGVASGVPSFILAASLAAVFQSLYQHGLAIVPEVLNLSDLWMLKKTPAPRKIAFKFSGFVSTFFFLGLCLIFNWLVPPKGDSPEVIAPPEPSSQSNAHFLPATGAPSPSAPPDNGFSRELANFLKSQKDFGPAANGQPSTALKEAASVCLKLKSCTDQFNPGSPSIAADGNPNAKASPAANPHEAQALFSELKALTDSPTGNDDAANINESLSKLGTALDQTGKDNPAMSSSQNEALSKLRRDIENFQTHSENTPRELLEADAKDQLSQLQQQLAQNSAPESAEIKSTLDQLCTKDGGCGTSGDSPETRELSKHLEELIKKSASPATPSDTTRATRLTTTPAAGQKSSAPLAQRLNKVASSLERLQHAKSATSSSAANPELHPMAPTPKLKPLDLKWLVKIVRILLIAGLALLAIKYLLQIQRAPEETKKKATDHKDEPHLRRATLKKLEAIDWSRLSAEQEAILRYNLFLEFMKSGPHPKHLSAPPDWYFHELSQVYPRLKNNLYTLTEIFSRALYAKSSIQQSDLVKFRADYSLCLRELEKAFITEPLKPLGV